MYNYVDNINAIQINIIIQLSTKYILRTSGNPNSAFKKNVISVTVDFQILLFLF